MRLPVEGGWHPSAFFFWFTFVFVAGGHMLGQTLLPSSSCNFNVAGRGGRRDLGKTQPDNHKGTKGEGNNQNQYNTPKPPKKV
jgi:hypothetical protein